MKKSLLTTSISVLAFSLAGVLATSALAQETPWQKSHPRRAEVNKRLKMQNKRINHEVKEGDINKAQAQQLRSNDRSIRAEERGMANQNSGHITKAEQSALNQQLNSNSAAIGK